MNITFNIPMKIAIVGFGESGKSTLFNAIFVNNYGKQEPRQILRKKTVKKTDLEQYLPIPVVLG